MGGGPWEGDPWGVAAWGVAPVGAGPWGGGPWGVAPVGAAQGLAGELVIRTEHIRPFLGEDFTFVSWTRGNIQSVGQKGPLMESVSIRRPTCKTPRVFRADRVDPVSFGFQLSPQTQRTEGRPAPPPPPSLSKASCSCSWQLCSTQLHSLNQLLCPQGGMRGRPLPPGDGRVKLSRAGASPGQHQAATRPGTQGHRCAKK